MDLAALKKKHRILFCSEIAGIQIFWRPLTWREHEIYEKILTFSLAPEGKTQDQIFREVVVSPEVVDQMYDLPAGIVPSLVNVVLLFSGNSLRQEDDLQRVNEDLITMRGTVGSSAYEQFIMLICKAFPSYTPRKVEDLEWYEMIRLVVMAESMLQLEEPVTLSPPKEEKSLTDKIFEDAMHARAVDDIPMIPREPGRGNPNPVSIRDYLNSTGANPEGVTHQQAKQIETARRIQERRRQGQG